MPDRSQDMVLKYPVPVKKHSVLHKTVYYWPIICSIFILWSVFFFFKKLCWEQTDNIFVTLIVLLKTKTFNIVRLAFQQISVISLALGFIINSYKDNLWTVKKNQ